MLNVKIDAPLDEAIARQAKRERKTKPALVRRAVEHYLEYVDDVRDVATVKRRREKSVPWSKVKTELEL